MSEQLLPGRKTIKVPGSDHPISIEHNPHRVVVTVAGRVVAGKRNALILREAGYRGGSTYPRGRRLGVAETHGTRHLLSL